MTEWTIGTHQAFPDNHSTRRSEIIDPRRDPAWDAFLASSDFGTVFSSSSWLRALADGYGIAPQASVVRDAHGQLSSGLLFAVIDDPFGVRVKSMPFSDYCDPVSADSAAFLSTAMPLLALDLPITLRVLRDTCARQSEIFAASSSAVWHRAEVLPTSAEQWEHLRGSSRRNIRHARESGLRVRVSTDLSDIARFHELHCELRKRKYRMLAQPRQFFEALHANFASGDRIVVLLVERDEELLAGVLFLVWNDTLFYKFNASRETADRPNDLLVWSGLELARELGLNFVDFGLSDIDQPGLLRFKSKFADEQRDISTLSWRPAAAPKTKNGSLLSELTEMLTDPSVPDDITIRGGEVLYRYFA